MWIALDKWNTQIACLQFTFIKSLLLVMQYFYL